MKFFYIFKILIYINLYDRQKEKEEEKPVIKEKNDGPKALPPSLEEILDKKKAELEEESKVG